MESYTMTSANGVVLYNSDHPIFLGDDVVNSEQFSPEQQILLGFRDSIDEYAVFASELSEHPEFLQIKRCMAIIITIRILNLISKMSKKEQLESVLSLNDFLRMIKKMVYGSLYSVIRDLVDIHDIVEPTQAPKGWKCSLCLENKDSHLCIKTDCNHYFHYGCSMRLESPICPMCRQIM